MLPVFMTSNQIPLHVHAVFCQLHVHCIQLARGMMRMRIPSNNYCPINQPCTVHAPATALAPRVCTLVPFTRVNEIVYTL